MSPLPVELPVAKFDLGLALRPDGEGGLEAAFEFRTDLLDRDTVERWAESYAVLLAELVAEPARAVASAPMHTPARADEVLALGVGRRIDGTVATAHGLVERAARLTPDAPALVVEDQELSYAELNHRADGLAARLRGAGVRPGVRVGIRLDRSVELYVAVLGVLKAGGAYVPLDPEYPQQRLDFMVADSGVALVLDEAELDAVGPAVETDAVAPDAIAYVCYTSGSTGKPKGVLVPHSGVSNLAAMQHEDFGMCADDRVLQFASLSFDASVFEMFMTWAAGACLVAVRADRRTGALLQSTLDDHEITVATLPPSIIGQLDPDANPGLRVLITAGEPCPRWLVNRWGQGRRLINAYGPTEATVCATAADLAPGDRLVVGKPIGNVRVHVLDEAQQVVPIGVVGEVYIGGAGIARGYLNRPELTAERFVSGLYRTGDLGRLCADGSLELLGRIDDQVKVHGFRIELGEVESAVAAHPEVVQAVATVSAGRLVAHVRTADGTVPTGLRGWLAQRAPAHLVPAVFQPIGEIPLSPTGKVDRRALPEPDMSRPELDIEYVAPRTGLERRLAELWSEVLNVSRIGVRDNFFDLGGDSLLLVALAARLESDGLPGSLVSLYLHQTIEELGDDLLTSGVSDD